ncbi:testis-specific gene A8 protein isoform X2 [Anabas testudineus]|uniref:testis-specific gene A8 protein isoform X2 n=1 Tax=Anabas testudineus TaxID=64144 RepID=UPI000E4638B1|nr:testis-specific gene A8 protein isoform X2 [Anabas testudineus]
MFCRRAWQRVGPLARRSLKPPCRNAPVRLMSFGVPGGSTNMTYFLLCGGGLTAAVVYAYKTVNSDSERYEDRLANMGTTTKAAAPAAESTPVEEAAPAVGVFNESVSISAEPVAEAAAELVESSAEEAASVASEVVVSDAEAEPGVTEESAPPVVVEAAAEAAPVAVTAETPPEAPAAEITGMEAVDEVPPIPPAEADIVPAVAEAESIPAADTAAQSCHGSV